MIKIYKITNLANGKVYIGQTKNSLSERLGGHCSPNSPCTKLRRAVKKYGKENFVIDEIDHAHTREEANSKEIFWIAYYKSTNDKHGYNILNGGHNAESARRKKVICLETGMIFDSITSAARFLGTKNHDGVGKVCNGLKPTYMGFRFAFLDKNGKPETNRLKLNYIPRHKKTICVETGRVFYNAKEAAKWLGVSRNAVSMCCRGYINTCGGYHWKYI